MRHKVAGSILGRDTQHRTAMRRNMAASLFEHETISTTIQKAKDVKPFVEKLITLAKRGDLHARRQVISLMGHDRKIYDYEEGTQVQKGTVVGKLFSEIGPRYLERPGGYTRIVKLSKRRLGDGGQVCLLQLVEKEIEKKDKKAPQPQEEQAQQQLAEEEQQQNTEEEPKAESAPQKEVSNQKTEEKQEENQEDKE